MALTCYGASSSLCLRGATVVAPPQSQRRPSCLSSHLAMSSQPLQLAPNALITGVRTSPIPYAAFSSSPSASLVDEEVSSSSGSEGQGSAVGEVDVAAEVPTASSRSVSPTACQACGKEEKVGGCNGEGRILGGLGSVPGFGWFPIKAYRPCPAFVEAGGRYKRQGQSLEEVAFGRTGKQDNLDITERLQGGNKPK